MTDTTWATTLAAGDLMSDSRSTLNSNFAAARRLTVAEIDNTDSPYTAGDVDLIIADATSGAITVNLPAGTVGDVYTIVKADGSGNAVTVDADGSDTINGSATKALSSQWDFVRVALYASGTWVEI